MRAKVGKVFRRLAGEAMAREWPSFRESRKLGHGTVLFSAPGRSVPWLFVLFFPHPQQDRFTMEVARSAEPDFPMAHRVHERAEWFARRDVRIAIGALTPTPCDLWWSPVPLSDQEHWRGLAHGTYPSEQEFIDGLPEAMAAAMACLREHAMPVLELERDSG